MRVNDERNSIRGVNEQRSENMNQKPTKDFQGLVGLVNWRGWQTVMDGGLKSCYNRICLSKPVKRNQSYSPRSLP